MKNSHFVIWMTTIIIVIAIGVFVAVLVVNWPPPTGDIVSLANEAWAERVFNQFYPSLIISLFVTGFFVIIGAFLLDFLMEMRESRPHLYRWGNSGVTALVRKKDFDLAEPRHLLNRRGEMTLRVIPQTMTFSDFRHFNMTGRTSDMVHLVEGCIVEDRSFFVPHSSLIWGSWEQQEKWCPWIRLDEAYQLVHRGCRQPQVTTAA